MTTTYTPDNRTKRCPCCNQWKAIGNFCLRHGKPNTYCKECAAMKAKAYRQREPMHAH